MSELKDFTIQSEMRLQVDLKIKAKSLEDALEQSRKLKETDFVKIPNGNFIDGELVIMGVWTHRASFERKD